MSLGKEIGDAILELSQCIYNTLKKNNSQIELIEAISNGNNKMLFRSDEWPAFFKKNQTLTTIEGLFVDGIDECEGKIFRFNVVKPGKIFNGTIQLVYEENDKNVFVPMVFLGTAPKVPKPSKAVVKPKAKTITVEQIIKKHKLNELEADIFKNYVEYMNEESKAEFLQKAYSSDRDYINQFIDTDLEDFGQERFGEIDYGDKRKLNVDMYNMVKNKDTNQILLVYAGFLGKIRDVSKEIRRDIYTDQLGIKKDKYNSADIIGKREIVYKQFNRFLSKLAQPQLEKFIDDIFDKKVSIENMFEKKVELKKVMTKDDMGKWLAQTRKEDKIQLKPIMKRDDMAKWIAQNHGRY